MPKGWEWDETLYQGSAPYYARGRLPYAPGLAELAQVLALDGRGRLLDVGCGPGILTLTLAHLVQEAVGLDPDGEMLAEGARRAAAAGIGNVRWVQARAEELPRGLGACRVATFGQSFHWMDRERVAAIVFAMLEPGGAFVHVADVKEPSAAPDGDLPHPPPPYEDMRELVRRYLGPVPRAGQGVLRYGTPDNEAAVLRGAGFTGPQRLVVPASSLLTRTTDDLVAWVYSLAGSAPHLFAGQLAAFDTDLRTLLGNASPAGRFSELPPDTEVFIWR